MESALWLWKMLDNDCVSPCLTPWFMMYDCLLKKKMYFISNFFRTLCQRICGICAKPAPSHTLQIKQSSLKEHSFFSKNHYANLWVSIVPLLSTMGSKNNRWHKFMAPTPWAITPPREQREKEGKTKTFPVALAILFPGFTGMSLWSTDLISDTHITTVKTTERGRPMDWPEWADKEREIYSLGLSERVRFTERTKWAHFWSRLRLMVVMRKSWTVCGSVGDSRLTVVSFLLPHPILPIHASSILRDRKDEPKSYQLWLLTVWTVDRTSVYLREKKMKFYFDTKRVHGRAKMILNFELPS